MATFSSTNYKIIFIWSCELAIFREGEDEGKLYFLIIYWMIKPRRKVKKQARKKATSSRKISMIWAVQGPRSKDGLRLETPSEHNFVSPILYLTSSTDVSVETNLNEEKVPLKFRKIN